MISKENIEEIKNAIYMYCKTSKFCCLCMDKIPHNEHCWHIGSLRIGMIENLFTLINQILNDTTPQKFRVTEALHYLAGNGYLYYKNYTKVKDHIQLFGTVVHYASEKFWLEMKLKEEHPELETNLTNWY